MRQAHPLSAEILASVVLWICAFSCSVAAHQARGFEQWYLYGLWVVYAVWAYGHTKAAWLMFRNGR